MNDVAWDAGTWTTPPAHHEATDDGLAVTAREGSDAWRVTFRLNFAAQFDQAGVFIRTDETTWIKAGIEWSDGEKSLGRWSAGSFCCTPTRGGLTVHFTSWRTTPADTSLHPDC